MHSENIEYLDGQQKLLGKLIYDKSKHGDSERPAILVFPAFEGLSEFALKYAENFANQGYIAFAADMYGNAAEAHTIEGCLELVAPFLQDRSLVRRRALLAFATLKKLKLVAKNKIGAVGFCFGGMCVLEIARSGENLAAGISVHGVLSKANLPTSPIKSRLLILQGYQDPQAPPDSLPKFAHEMDAAGTPDWVFTFFSHAKHSFTDIKAGTLDPTREQKMGREYNPLAAERAWRYSLDFFAETIGNAC